MPKITIVSSFVFIFVALLCLASTVYGGITEDELSKNEDRDRICAQNIERTRNAVQNLSIPPRIRGRKIFCK